MKDFLHSASLLAWMTQFGFSIAAPLTGCILLSVWLQERFALGGWVVAVGVVLGLIGAVGGLATSIRLMDRQAAATQKHNYHRGDCFNRH